MYGHMTHQLAALAGERVVVAKEGGYNLVDCDQAAAGPLELPRRRGLLGPPGSPRTGIELIESLCVCPIM